MLIDEVQKLPLEMVELQKVLEAKTKMAQEAPVMSTPTMFSVSYKESKLKDKFFINYVANLKLSIALEEEDISKDEKFNLLTAYMDSSNVSEIETLSFVLAAILLEDKGMDIEEDLWLSKEERKEFSQNHKETLKVWHRFLESIPACLPFCLENYVKQVGKKLIEDNIVEVITDANAIGRNVASLTDIEGFVENYLSLQPTQKPALFESQWFEPVFGGFSFMQFMQSGNNTLFPFMVGIEEKWITRDHMKEILSQSAA